MSRSRTPGRRRLGKLARLMLAPLALAALPEAGAAQYFEQARDRSVTRPAVAAETTLDDVMAMASTPGVARRTTGDHPLLVIPALFQDSPEPHIASGQLESVLFGTTGRTLTTYYQEVSGQRLTVVGTVAEWVRSDVPIEEAAGEVNGHGYIGPLAQQHFRAAIAAVDDDIDFQQYDNDGPDGVPDSGDDDGIVDAVTFLNIETGGHCGGPGFWAHVFGLSAEDGSFGAPTTDIGSSGAPIRVGLYVAESAVDCGGQDVQTASVRAHEFGHVLGLPDLYVATDGIERSQRHWVVGCFGLMGAGSWGCGAGERPASFGPTHLSPLMKERLGWIELEEVGEVTDQEFVLEPVQTSGRALSVPLSADSDEWLLIEYRPRLGFDDVLPDGGVLIYHYDPGSPIGRFDAIPNYSYYLVEADGDDSLRKLEDDGGDAGSAADMFARGGATDSLTRSTTPSTDHNGGQPAMLVIHSIAVDGDVARIRLSTTSTLRGRAIAAPTEGRALEPYTGRFRVSHGTPPYTAIEPEGGLPVEGLSLTMENGDEVVLSGAPLDEGFLTVPISVQDAEGEVWWHRHSIDVRDADLDDARLLEPFALGAPSGDPALNDLIRYMDNAGNGNGVYDMGDVRAFFQRTGGL